MVQRDRQHHPLDATVQTKPREKGARTAPIRACAAEMVGIESEGASAQPGEIGTIAGNENDRLGRRGRCSPERRSEQRGPCSSEHPATREDHGLVRAGGSGRLNCLSRE